MEGEEPSERPHRRFGGGFGRGGFRRRAGPVPADEGEQYEVTADATGRKGDRITKTTDSAIFVPRTKTGDRVKVKITGVGSNLATASVVAQGGNEP